VKKDLLIIFVKNPILGQVKSRLAYDIGPQNALEVYRILLKHTRDITQDLNCDKVVFYFNHIEENDLWGNEQYLKLVQSGNDLGEKISNAFELGFNRGYEKICIIGSDCWEIDKGIINEAFKNLDHNQLVIGPASDGGYYLLGMDEYFPFLFQNKSWSTEKLAAETLGDAKAHHLKTYTLITLNDIDTGEDLKSARIDFPVE